MYQSQQYQTSNYRGNQQGHDAYLRSDFQSPSSLSGAQNVTSQYRGFQRPFQPTGYVSSVYGQNTNTGMNPSNTGFSSFSGTNQPSQSQFGGSQGGYNPSFNNFNTGFTNAGITSFNQNQGQNQYASPESYHTANYRGNQQGHDNYLRADSTQPAQHQFGISSSGTGYGHVGTSNFSSINNNIGASTFGGSSIGSGNLGSSAGASNFGTTNFGSSFGTSGLGAGAATFGTSNLGTYGSSNAATYNQNQNQFVSPESYHTANYRGNQQGHDTYLRADSQQPTQSQFGAGMGTSSFGSFSNR